MGHRTVYSCDWCEAESPPDADGYGDCAPEDWWEGPDELICGNCAAARSAALVNVRAQCAQQRNGSNP